MSGPSDDYDGSDEAALEAELEDAWGLYEAPAGGGGGGGYRGDPTRMTVRAEVEWAGVKDRANHGVRTVNLDGLDLRAVRQALTAAHKAREQAGAAGSSFNATGWRGQLSTLLRNSRGQAASERAGLSPTSKTVLAWLSEDRAPNKANQDKIAAAYRDVRDQVVSDARYKAERAYHDVATKVNEALADRYDGAEIRLRHITQMTLGN